MGDSPNTPSHNREPSNLIGKSFRRVDGRSKVTGRTRYADDLSFPRMCFMVLVRSTVPHANILGIDVAEASEMPGVLGFLTGEDLPHSYGILPMSRDEHGLARGKVRFVGDPVVAVAALTEEQARDAARVVKIDYEPLTTIGSVQEALDNPEPRIHDYGSEGNLHRKKSMIFGQVDDGFGEADMVLEDTCFFDGNTHMAMEQQCSIAVPEDEGRLTLHSSTQVPHYVHRSVARALALPESRVRVIATTNGGGFGGKSDIMPHEIVVSKMALKLGRPVKITLTRDEVFYCHRGRHPVTMWLRTGFKKDGTITAHHLKTALDGGAFASYGVASTLYTGALQATCYQLQRYRFDVIRAFTNKPPCGPKRGHGTPQPRFGLEVHLDKAAHKLGMDPADLRLKNLTEPFSITCNWLQLGTVGLKRCIEAVVEGSGWRERYGKLPEGRGLGLACGSYICGVALPLYKNPAPHSAVQIKLDRSGGVAVFCGQAEIGQGSDSMLAAIVAEILGIELADIRLCVADTDLTPIDFGSYASRVTMMMGNAAMEAADKARDFVARGVSDELGIPVERLVFAERRVFDCEDPERGMDFGDAVLAAEGRFGAIGTTGSYTPIPTPGRFQGSGVGPSPTYSFSASVIEVEVDPATGLWRPVHVWLAHDIGRALNPTLTVGQVEGSVYMGLGEVMMEEQAFRRLPKKRSNALVHKMPSLLEYKSLTFQEMPPVTTYLIEDPDPRGPFGGKEVGQGPLLPIMPAVANAIYDAVGVRVDQVPIHPHMVLKALEDKATGKEGRFGPDRYPDVDFSKHLLVPTPAEGGDGTALNDPRKAGKKTMAKSA